MCGIFATRFGGAVPQKNVLAHRGPDSVASMRVDNVNLMFWRLDINGVGTIGAQPFQKGNKYLIANAEIYNHKEFGNKEGSSDCEILLPMIEEHGFFRTCELIRGDFAFVFTDGENIWAARDRVGVRPLFWCRSNNAISFASEAKALLHLNACIEIFPPGHLYDSRTDALVCWAPNYWDSPREDRDDIFVKSCIRELMYESVKLRVENTERPVGFFLSGGLDSSIIAAIGKEILGKIQTFSIGLENSPDLLAARKMADFLESEHTEVHFTAKEGIAAIRDVIRHLETFDTTTIRASVPMYLLSKYISENTDIKVILSGEGSDELFGGYLYFHGAPDVSAFDAEMGRLVRDVHMFDVLRADRTTAAFGLELRVPFFDRDVIDYVMDGFDPDLKMPRGGFEKFLLRETFEDILPTEIAWRQKNGMSDAVGYEWVDALREFGEHKYLKIFHEFFGHQTHLCPYKWMPKWTEVTDPSARNLPAFQPN